MGSFIMSSIQRVFGNNFKGDESEPKAWVSTGARPLGLWLTPPRALLAPVAGPLAELGQRGAGSPQPSLFAAGLVPDSGPEEYCPKLSSTLRAGSGHSAGGLLLHRPALCRPQPPDVATLAMCFHALLRRRTSHPPPAPAPQAMPRRGGTAASALCARNTSACSASAPW